MKIIKSFDEWCNSALSLLENSKYCYVASFNLQFRENDKVQQILNRVKTMEHKVLIGFHPLVCTPGCAHCRLTNQIKYEGILKTGTIIQADNFKITSAFHMKTFITSNGVIVGGMNITGSGWTDRSFLTTNRELTRNLLIDFQEVYYKAHEYNHDDFVDTRDIFTFGKYKGRKIEDIRKEDPAYFVWLHNNTPHRF